MRAARGGSEYSTGIQHQHRHPCCKQEGPPANQDHTGGYGHVAKGIRDWELEEEQSVGGISIPSPSSWQAPGNRQARQTELAAGIYGETAIALGLPTFCCSRTACPTYAPALSWGLEPAEKYQAVLEDVSGGGASAEELALGTRVHGRAPRKETALAWICTSRVISLQNREAKTKVDGIKKIRTEMFPERHGESS